LLVEDDATLRHVLAREIEEAGFSVTAEAGCAAAERAARESEHELALVDMKLGDGDGLELLPRLLALDPDLQVVMLTGHGAVREAVTAMRLGAYDFLQKPASLTTLEQALRRALDRRALVRENRGLRRITEPPAAEEVLIGESEPIRALRDLLPKVACSDVGVLITGESGVGKELVARSLHRLGPRAERPFVVVDCGAISEALLESELFGHEKGAYTGAERKRPGLFEAADGGTLFLDEIGELPLLAQPSLLRALQFGEIRSVGSERSRRVDVRVVAATNRDLLKEVAAGKFREDLYWRLAAMPLRVPALRERRADVVVLARTLLARGSPRRLELTPEALARLSAHAWPGNVRELENVLRRLVLLVPGPEIGEGDVVAQLDHAQARVDAELPTLDLYALERIAVAAALERHQGDKRKAAAELGVSLKTLYNMVARHGLR
jgi:DNA-binding NtrC family response regulator